MSTKSHDININIIPNHIPYEYKPFPLRRSGIAHKLLKHQNTCGTLLTRLSEKHPERIQWRMLHGKRHYTIQGWGRWG
jgi:hypothetical protein